MGSARVAQAVERFSEDEALRGDLTDAAASALLTWLEQQVEAADVAVDDATFTQRLRTIRAAALAAARAASSAASDDLVATATALLNAQPAAGSAPATIPAPAAGSRPQGAGNASAAASDTPRLPRVRRPTRRARTRTRRKA